MTKTIGKLNFILFAIATILTTAMLIWACSEHVGRGNTSATPDARHDSRPNVSASAGFPEDTTLKQRRP